MVKYDPVRPIDQFVWDCSGLFERVDSREARIIVQITNTNSFFSFNEIFHRRFYIFARDSGIMCRIWKVNI